MANPPLRAFLVGCGSICGSWLPHIVAHPDLTLAALVDLHPETARKRAQEYGLAAVPVETQVLDGGDGFQRPTRAVEVPAADFPTRSEGHASIIAEFVAAVRAGAVPETICTDNIQSLAMVFGAVESAERNARIAIPAA